MQKALATILLAAVAGVPTYLLVWASPFGVSRGFPLGQLESMEAWLLDHGFAKKTLSEADPNQSDEYPGFELGAEVSVRIFDQDLEEESDVLAMARIVRLVPYGRKISRGWTKLASSVPTEIWCVAIT